MAQRMVVELSDGTKVLFGGKGHSVGLTEASLAGDIAKVTEDRFKSALGSLASLVASLEQSVGGMAHKPDKVEMEFRASLTADCDLWIVSGEGEAEFKVTLGWGKAG